MPQTLFLEKNRSVEVDRVWMDGGKDPTYAMFGGQKVVMDIGSKPKPTVYQIKNQFFYPNLEPVTNPDHVSWFPEPFKTTALKFIEAGVVKPPKVKIIRKSPPQPDLPTTGSTNPHEIMDEASYLAAGGKLEE